MSIIAFPWYETDIAMPYSLDMLRGEGHVYFIRCIGSENIQSKQCGLLKIKIKYKSAERY